MQFGKERGSAGLAAPQGFEPRYADPESAVLPLNEGAVLQESRGAKPPFHTIDTAHTGQCNKGYARH